MDQDSWRWKLARFVENYRSGGLIVLAILAVAFYAFTDIGPRYRPLDLDASIKATQSCIGRNGGESQGLNTDAMVFSMGNTSQVGSVLYGDDLPPSAADEATLKAAGNKIEHASHAVLLIGPDASDADIAVVRRCTVTITRDPVTSLMAFDIIKTTQPFAA